MTEPGARQRRAKERITTALAEVGFALPGSLVWRTTACGKTGCHCQANPPVLHGPYLTWTRTVNGKTVTRKISATRPLPGMVRQRPPTPPTRHRPRNPVPPSIRANRRNQQTLITPPDTLPEPPTHLHVLKARLALTVRIGVESCGYLFFGKLFACRL